MIIIFMTINTLACVHNNMPSNGVCLPIRLLVEVYYCRIVLILFKRLQFVVETNFLRFF